MRSDALVPCLTEVVLASWKEKATKVVSEVPVGVENPLPNEEGIGPNNRFRFTDAGPNVKLEESLPSIRRGTVLGDGSRSKVVVLVTKEGQEQADKTVNLTVGKTERNLDNQLRIGKESTRDTTLG